MPGRVSLHDSDARPIAKGRLGKPIEFGYKAGEQQVDFVMLEQGIDTSTPGGRLVFHFLAALAEYDHEMIVDGTLDGLAAARARGRVGGRPAALSQRQLDTAQQMYALPPESWRHQL